MTRRVWLALPLLVTALCAEGNFTRPAAWGPYLRNEKGVESSLAEPIEKMKDKDWLGLQWTPFQGPKSRIVVLEVENKATPGMQDHPGAAVAAAMAAAMGQGMGVAPVAAIEDLLNVGLQATNRFRLFERKAIQAMLAEKQLAAGGQAAVQTSPAAAPSRDPMAMIQMAQQMQAQAAQAEAQRAALPKQAGRLVGAQFLVIASVNEWTPDKSQKGMSGAGLGKGLLGGLGLDKSEAEVAMTFRIVDVASGETVQSLTERATAGKWGLSFFGVGVGGNGAAGVGGQFKENTPVNYAIRACINKAVYRIAKALENKPWQSTVVRVAEGGKVYINGGLDSGLIQGMALRATSVGEEIKDPATGEVLGQETSPAGVVRVQEVKDRFAIGIYEGTVPLKVGDRVGLEGSGK